MVEPDLVNMFETIALVVTEDVSMELYKQSKDLKSWCKPFLQVLIELSHRLIVIVVEYTCGWAL